MDRASLQQKSWFTFVRVCPENFINITWDSICFRPLSSHCTQLMTSCIRRAHEQLNSNFLGFDLDLWPLGVTRGCKNIFTMSKAHRLYDFRSNVLLTLFLYLVPFSRYSTSTFLWYDLDLWPSGGHPRSKYFNHLKAHIWLTIKLLLTFSPYLVPFSRKFRSKFYGRTKWRILTFSRSRSLTDIFHYYK